MIAASQAPGVVPPFSSSSTMAELVLVSGWSRRKGEVHQMGDALLPATTVWILHTGQLGLCILIHKSVRCLALRLVLRFRRLNVARGGVATRRASTGATGGIREESLGCRDGWGRRRGTGRLLRVGRGLGQGGRLGRHFRRLVRIGSVERRKQRRMSAGGCTRRCRG